MGNLALLDSLQSRFGVSRTTLMVGGLASAAFVGYCVYFDKKRRSDPDFKRKLRERRLQSRQSGNPPRSGALPQFNDVTEMQQFFMQELQLGEELMGEGDTDGALDHFVRAVQMAGMTPQLLQIFQQTLPPPIFGQLVDRIRQTQRDNPSQDRMNSAGDTGFPVGIEDDTTDLE